MNDYLQFVNGKMLNMWLGRNDIGSFLQFPIDDVHWPPYSNSSSDEDKRSDKKIPSNVTTVLVTIFSDNT